MKTASWRIKVLPYWLSDYVPFTAIALYPFIWLRLGIHRTDRVLLNHERIHWAQQAELLVLPFYVLYLLNYLFNLLKYRRHSIAYLNIVFEKEAYANEAWLDYLPQRRRFNFLKYW